MTIRKIYAVWALALMALTSCVGDGGETIPLEFQKPTEDISPIDGIPSDAIANKNPSVTPTVAMPDVTIQVVTGSKGVQIAEILLPGLRYPASEDWLTYLTGTDGGADYPHVWVSVDGDPKGCKVLNNFNEEVGAPIDVEIVFLVNNSNNMKEAGDMLYRSFDNFAYELAACNLSVRYGCVGYGGGDSSKGVDGACKPTDAVAFKAYLGREGCTGVTRTKGFVDNEALEQLAQSRFQNCEGECGVEALKFADSAFPTKGGAYRVYLNLTDEPNQPEGDSQWSVETVKTQDLWCAGKGTIHTLFSGNKEFTNQVNNYEHPWLLSDYTGGFVTYTDSKLTDVTLSSLPMTVSLKRFATIRIAKVEKYMDDKAHDMKITVMSKDMKLQADKTFKAKFGAKE